jgi:ABC-type Fe3+/spermidine/putrescine transport system ATPase subunit
MQLKVENLSKDYRCGVRALRGVQISLRPGILGLLGPNGAGKSTLMRILATVTRPSSGRVLWNETDIAENPDFLRNTLGYLPQDFGVYPNLSAIEFLEYGPAHGPLVHRPDESHAWPRFHRRRKRSSGDSLRLRSRSDGRRASCLCFFTRARQLRSN